MIITISRELGRRLSEQMQIPCYDKEIISLIARNIGFDESYVEMMSEKGIQSAYLGTFSSRFAGVDWYTPPVHRYHCGTAEDHQRSRFKRRLYHHRTGS